MKPSDLKIGEPFCVWEMDDDWLAEELLAITEQEEPPFDPRRVIELMGYEVRERRMVSHGVVVNATREVLVNEAISGARRSFTLAHELGHLVRQHDRSVSHARENWHEPDHERRAADQFAAALLMPESVVRSKVAEVGFTDARRMAPLFGVSVEAMEIRLRDLGL